MLKCVLDELAWDKMQGLLPAIVQDATSGAVLMLGYMNKEALQLTVDTQWVTFYSRSQQKLWRKGETSGNHLQAVAITADCDKDTLLILAKPSGPVCHLGTTTCFVEHPQTDFECIQQVEKIIDERYQQRPSNSYTAALFNAGIQKIAQKVGEEGVETTIAALVEADDKLCAESADLLFHLLILLRERNLSLSAVIDVLRGRVK